MINRLLGIVYILISKGNVTATELAKRFEVSIRTIYRDIETLSMAGIPVYTKKGKNGGICLMEQFVLNKMLISREEQQQILSALISVRETSVLEEQGTLQKLGEFFELEPVDWLAIDLSDWGGARRQIYEDIKNAVLTHRVISFDYFGQNRAMSRRTVEPVQMIFKEYTWYLKAFCRERQAFRTFKLFRIKRLEVLEEIFQPKRIQESTTEQGEATENTCTEIIMWIDKKEAYRVYDRFDEHELEELEDGNFLVHLYYSVDEWVYNLILSFGASAKVLSPEPIKEEIQRRIQDMMKIYNLKENMPS